MNRKSEFQFKESYVKHLSAKTQAALQDGLQILASMIAEQVIAEVKADQSRVLNAPPIVSPSKTEPPKKPKEESLGERLLRADEVVKKVGVSRSTIWRWEQAGRFPKRRKIGDSSVAWACLGG